MTSAATLAPPQATQQQIADQRRRTEADPDFARLHAATVRRLDRCLRQFLRNLRRSDMGDADAQSAFIHHATDVLRSAYEEAHREGQRDYWHQVSLKRNPPLSQPAETRVRQVLAWYATGSLTKMAREAGQAVAASRHAANNQGTNGQSMTVKSAEIISENYKLDDGSGDPLDEWYDGTDQRVGLQASITWVGLQDGTLDSGRMDPAAPFTLLYWNLEPAAAHCGDCLDLASNNPYNAPWVSGGNQLEQSPGDGRTVCGASCKCDLSYAPDTSADEQIAAAKWQAFLQNAQPYVDQIGTAAGYQSPPDYRGYGQYGPMLPYNAPAFDQQEQEQQALVPPDVIPTPRTSVLSDDQKAALDRMRDAIEAWDTLRGDLPEAPEMFAQIEDAAGESGLPTGGMLPNWETLTPEQQHTISEMVAALWDWYAATEEDIAGDLDQLFAVRESGGMLLAGHPPGYDEQDHDPKTGQWLPGKGPIGGGPIGGEQRGGKKGKGTGGMRRRAGTPEHAASVESKIDDFYTKIEARQQREGGTPRVDYESEKARAYLTTTFGRQLSDQEVAGLAGAEPGAHVTVGKAGWLTNEGPGGRYEMVSVVQRPTEGDPHLTLMAWSNREPWYPKTAYGQQLSAPANPRALRAQVIAARQTGIERIDVKCHGFDNDWVKTLQMGFDRPIDVHLIPELAGHSIPAGFHGRTIGEVVLNNGRTALSWWKGVRSSLSMRFYPQSGSTSMQRFNRYLRNHGIKEVPDT